MICIAFCFSHFLIIFEIFLKFYILTLNFEMTQLLFYVYLTSDLTTAIRRRNFNLNFVVVVSYDSDFDYEYDYEYDRKNDSE